MSYLRCWGKRDGPPSPSSIHPNKRKKEWKGSWKAIYGVLYPEFLSFSSVSFHHQPQVSQRNMTIFFLQFLFFLFFLSNWCSEWTSKLDYVWQSSEWQFIFIINLLLAGDREREREKKTKCKQKNFGVEEPVTDRLLCFSSGVKGHHGYLAIDIQHTYKKIDYNNDAIEDWNWSSPSFYFFLFVIIMMEVRLFIPWTLWLLIQVPIHLSRHFKRSDKKRMQQRVIGVMTLAYVLRWS